MTETRLPGIDGFALCDLLRRDVTTQGIPVVFVTGDAYPPDIERARAGADLVLTKPCLPEDLLTHIRSLLETPRTLRHDVQPRAGLPPGRTDKLLSRAVDPLHRRRTLTKAHQRGDDRPAHCAAFPGLSVVRPPAGLPAKPRGRGERPAC